MSKLFGSKISNNFGLILNIFRLKILIHISVCHRKCALLISECWVGWLYLILSNRTLACRSWLTVWILCKTSQCCRLCVWWSQFMRSPIRRFLRRLPQLRKSMRFLNGLRKIRIFSLKRRCLMINIANSTIQMSAIMIFISAWWPRFY